MSRCASHRIFIVNIVLLPDDDFGFLEALDDDFGFFDGKYQLSNSLFLRVDVGCLPWDRLTLTFPYTS